MHDRRHAEGGDQPALGHIAPRHAEHVAEQDVVEMNLGLDLGVEHDAEAEHAGEHDAHHRVLLDAAVLLEVAGRQRAEHAGGECADGERNAGDVGEHDARQHGVADGVAHQRPALEHQEAGEQRRRHRHQQRYGEGLLHEGKLERQEQRLDHAPVPGTSSTTPASSASLARRRAASSPCFGAKTKAARKISVCATTMMPPVAPSRK